MSIETGTSTSNGPWTVAGVGNQINRDAVAEQRARREGGGDAGTIVAMPAVVNAAVDALQPSDVDSLDAPPSNESV